jgi:transposase-like protein
MNQQNHNTIFGTTCRSRACREGWLGRRRTYTCRTCGDKFTVDTLNPLPEERRNCLKCRTAVVQP